MLQLRSEYAAVKDLPQPGKVGPVLRPSVPQGHRDSGAAEENGAGVGDRASGDVKLESKSAVSKLIDSMPKSDRYMPLNWRVEALC